MLQSVFNLLRETASFIGHNLDFLNLQPLLLMNGKKVGTVMIVAAELAVEGDEDIVQGGKVGAVIGFELSLEGNAIGNFCLGSSGASLLVVAMSMRFLMPVPTLIAEPSWTSIRGMTSGAPRW